MLRIKKKEITIFVFLFLYKLLLDLSYIILIHREFEYMGFVLNFNLFKYIFGVFIFVVMFYILPKDKQKPSSLFLQIHFIIMLLPMFTIYAFMNESTLFFVLNISMFSLQCILLKRLPSIKIVRIKNSRSILNIILFGLTTIVYFSMLKANGLPSLQALNLSKVYEIRSTVSYPFLMDYLVEWQAKVINPFLITTAFVKKNTRLFFIAISLQILLYLITAHKSYLLIPFAILFVINVISKRDFMKVSSITAALGTIAILSYYIVSKSLMIPSLLLRRFLFIPAQIKFYYYDFFSMHKYMYFSEGAIGSLFGLTSPYNMDSANMIGQVFFNNSQIHANTGYLADAYANMGVIGMLLISLLFVFVLVMVNSLNSKIGNSFTIGLSIFPILSLNDGALLTTLLTGGLLFHLILLYLYSSSHTEVNRSLKKLL